MLTAVETSQPWVLGEVAEQVNAGARELVESAAKLLQSHGLSADGAVAEGDPKTVILDHAAAMGADLVAVGAQGMSAVERFLMGSVSKAVLRFAPCSVAIARSAGARADAELKVLLAVDGSEGSRHAAESMAARPWPTGTEIRVY